MIPLEPGLPLSALEGPVAATLMESVPSTDSQPVRTEAVSAHAPQQEHVSLFGTLALPRPSSSLYRHSWSSKH